MSLSLRLFISVFIYFVCNCQLSEEADINFALTHWSDVRGQIESFKKNSPYSDLPPVRCINYESDLDCEGGWVNLVSVVTNTSFFRGVGVLSKNIFRLNSGNQLGGESGWVPVLGWGAFGSMTKGDLAPDVVTCGVKDFMGGLSKIMDYLKYPNTLQFKGTLANTCLATPEVTHKLESDFCNSMQKSKRLTLLNPESNNYQIGVVGFIDPIVEKMALPGSLVFSPIVESIKLEIMQYANLTPSINTFIAMGDGNLQMAKDIIDSVPEVKLVILSNGVDPTETLTDTYPIIYNNRYIATAGRYGSSVGKMVLKVDIDTGDLQLVKGSLVETAFPGNISFYSGAAKSFLHNMIANLGPAGQVAEKSNTIIGHSRVTLQGGELCWRQCCNLGNLVADAMVHCGSGKAKHFYDVPLFGLWPSGLLSPNSVRAGVRISEFDLLKWLPYQNKVHLVRITGKNLKRVLDASASGIDPGAAGEKDWGQLLQVSSGLEVTYGNFKEFNQPPRLLRLRIVQSENENGAVKLSDVRDDVKYYFVIPTFLYEGRGIYGFAKELWETLEEDLAIEDNCVEEYVKALKQVNLGKAERIKIRTECEENECESSKTLTVILTLVFATISVVVSHLAYFYVIPRLRRPHRD